MHVVYAIGEAVRLGRAVCAIGTFDGVHAGHRRLAERAAKLAHAEGAPAVAVVLWEGERSGDGAPGRLLTLLDERLALLADLERFDAALVVSQAPDTPAPSADALLSLVVRWVHPLALLGAIEPGSPPLAEAAAQHSMRLLEIALGDEEDEGEPGLEHGLEHSEARERTSMRTTMGERIADALLTGDMRVAGRLLSHRYGVGGVVVSGDRRGRVLGYPTANLRLDARKLLPADGIYAVRARLPGEPHAGHPAVASLGVRPQFGSGRPRLLEVFLLDAALDLYGLRLEVAFVERLREEQRFADVEALKAQMAQDVQMARDVLNRDDSDTGRATTERLTGERESSID